MNKEVLYNVPCGLFHGFLESDMDKRRIFDDILNYAAYREERRLEKAIPDHVKRWNEICRKLQCIIRDKEKTLDRGFEISVKHKNDAFFSISHTHYWDFCDNYKTEEECILLLAHLALKSICGNRKYIKTNRFLWLSRMDGKSAPKYKNGKKKTLDLSPAIKQYDTEYGARKLRSLLFQYYHDSFYTGSSRGFYYSPTLSIEELIMAVRNDNLQKKDLLKIAMKSAQESVEGISQESERKIVGI